MYHINKCDFFIVFSTQKVCNNWHTRKCDECTLCGNPFMPLTYLRSHTGCSPYLIYVIKVIKVSLPNANIYSHIKIIFLVIYKDNKKRLSDIWAIYSMHIVNIVVNVCAI